MTMIPAENIFSIYHVRDADEIASRMQEIKESHQGLVLRQIVFNISICAALWKAIQTRQDLDKAWNKVELRNVDGDTTSALSTCLAFDSIEELQLVSNNTEIRDEGWFAIAVGLRTNSKLKTLRITTALLPSGMRELSQGLVTPTISLQTLDFSWSTFEDHETLQELALALRENTTLRELIFMGCSLYDQWVAELVEALVSHPCFKTLNFNSNKAGPLTSHALESYLETNSALTKLNTSFQTNDDPLNIPPLAAALRQNTTLETWDLSNCHLGDNSAEELGHVVLCNNPSLKEGFLARNSISDKGIKTLGRLLPGIKGLKRISLWGNPFEDEGANALAEGLESNHELEEVDLFHNFPCSQRIIYHTQLNRAGRRLMYDAAAPLALWPLVLERIERLTCLSNCETASLELQYYLLRNSTILYARG
jgi:hypothetical protein